jgi:hypothetical protein
MPVELTWESRGVYRRYFGDVTARERYRSFDQICADPRFDDLRYVITDYLAVRSYEISDDDTPQIAALHVAPMRTNPNIVIAAVVVDEQIIAAIRHFISLRFITQPYEIFSTLPEARAWIARLHVRAAMPLRFPG